MLAQDLVLVGERLGRPEDVPDVGVLGDDPERLPLAAAADHDRQVRLDRQRLDPEVVEGVAATGRARHLVAVEQDPRVGRGLGQPVEPLPEAGPEVDAERPVLVLEPRPADAHDRPAAADVVDRRHALDREPRVAERVRPDEQPEADPLGRLGDGGERRVALEDRLVGVAEDRLEVVPGPDVVVAETLGATCAAARNAGQSLAWLQSAIPSFRSVIRSTSELMKSNVCTRLQS